MMHGEGHKVSTAFQMKKSFQQQQPKQSCVW